jgi:hypothetical protein
VSAWRWQPYRRAFFFRELVSLVYRFHEHLRKGVESPGLFQRFLPTLKPHVGTIVNTVVASIVPMKSKDLGHRTEGVAGMH